MLIALFTLKLYTNMLNLKAIITSNASFRNSKYNRFRIERRFSINTDFYVKKKKKSSSKKNLKHRVLIPCVAQIHRALLFDRYIYFFTLFYNSYVSFLFTKSISKEWDIKPWRKSSHKENTSNNNLFLFKYIPLYDIKRSHRTIYISKK